ncbi:MAG: serine/threonine protein kinase [Oceanospirillaceae bacterium]|nr:serine/threonine protein kinase [Oceanospirillaceae bacterium]
MNPSDLQLPGYEIEAVLSRGSGRVTYRARRLADGAAVAIETWDAEYPERQQVAEIRREASIAQRLSGINGVREVDAVVPHGGGNLALVCELFESSMAHRLEQNGGQGLPLNEVLEVALSLVRTLGAIHANEIIHKALAPEHILLDPASGDIALAGFGIASELDQERQAVQMSRRVEGPLPYISPEQTGRMNRDLDYRSDYYSLGVLLFELLTGQRPFQADNALEWVHSHLSQRPPAPHELNAAVPEAVSAIVLKLLSKNPEARYQSAEGITHDLELCANRLAAGRLIEPFQPGEKDRSHKFLLPQKLYGRDREIDQLLTLFESAAAGQTEFCLVHGYSGVGKSALVNELDRPLVRERGFLVQGKFDQFQQGAPCKALASAFRGLVHQVLALPSAQLAIWRERLNEALAPNARLVVELVPELELIIGSQPAVAPLPPAEARNRLNIVLTAFLHVFAGAGHPVVLFLDDLQWSDAPTLELLRRVMLSHETSHLFLVGAYRSNEVAVGHPLLLILDDLKTHRTVKEIPIGPLDPGSVNHLVADALSRTENETRELGALLYEKAQGNPFFTNELIRGLYLEGAITPEAGTGRWSWDLDQARWAQMSSDVVEFMLESLRRLPPETQQVLQLAACIGASFDLNTLSVIYQRSATDTARALLPALKLHAVLPLHSHYRLVNERADESGEAPFNPVYRFQHDRVQQAAYALIDRGALAAVHLSVGRLILASRENSVSDNRVIEIVDHLNLGRSLVDAECERIQLCRLNLRAAVRAHDATAYEAAWTYLQVAGELMPGHAWSAEPELMRSWATEVQQCAYLTGRTEAADHWIDVLLEHAESDLERGDILAVRTRQYATLGRMEESIQSAIQGLTLLGVEFSSEPTAADIERERQHVVEYLGNRRIPDLVDAPQVEDPATLIAMRLLMEIFAAAFLSGSGNLFPYLVLKSVNLSLRHGNCSESAFSYAAYGMLLCGELDEPRLGYEYAKVGLAINERLDDLPLRSRVVYVFAMFVNHWNNHWSSLTPLFRKGIEAGYQSGDLLYLAYSAQDCVIWDPTLDLETAHRLHAENLEIVRECAYQDSLDSGTLFLQLQRNLMGLTDGMFSLSDENFDEQRCLAGMRERQFMTGIANYHIYSAEIAFLYGDYDRAQEHVYAQDRLIKSAMSLPQLVRFYIVAFLTLASQYPSMTPAQQRETQTRLERDLARMTRWADNCPENFRHHQYLMQAELARLQGQSEQALELFEAAIDAAGESGFIRDEATACERAAQHLLGQGRKRAAEGYLRGACRLYERWGAHRKVSHMTRQFPILIELLQPPSSAANSTADLDLASIMKASREISGEIVLERLLKTSIDILLESAGGQWGCLLARHEGQLTVEAIRWPQEGLAYIDVPEHSLVTDSDGNRVPLPMTVISQVLHSGEAVVLGEAYHQGDFVADPYIRNCQPVSLFCAPIQRERFEGVIYMENNLASNVFTEARVELIRLLTAQAAVAIENAGLYEQVQEYSRTLEQKVAERTTRLKQLNQELQGLVDRDGLTGVANRRRGDAYLKEVWKRLRRERRPLSLIMLDVDHFKAFNDNYGHQAGDDCLTVVASVINDQLKRPADMVARYGGEEFMVILPDTDKEGAQRLAEQVREALESRAIEHAFSSAGNRVTVSAGGATLVPGSDGGPELLLREADIALYRAKRMGRNRVQVG